MTDINDMPAGLKIVTVAGEYATYGVDEDGAFMVNVYDTVNNGMTASDVELWSKEMLAAVDVLKGAQE